MEHNNKEINNQIKEESVQFQRPSFFQSRGFITILWIVGGVILLLLMFKAGEMVESQKADFSYRWGQNYYSNFVGRPSLNADIGGNNLMMTHGVFGSIISVNAPDLIVQDINNNVEKDIITSTGTLIRDLNKAISFKDLETNERVIIIGSPNASGQIEARLIRVVPNSSFPPGGAQLQTRSQSQIKNK